jgi:hypothetical protein
MRGVPRNGEPFCLQVTTFGKKGAVLLKRVDQQTGREQSRTLQGVIEDLMGQLQKLPAPVEGREEPACMAPNDVPIFPGKVIKSDDTLVLTLDRYGPKPHGR